MVARVNHGFSCHSHPPRFCPLASSGRHYVLVLGKYEGSTSAFLFFLVRRFLGFGADIGTDVVAAFAFRCLLTFGISTNITSFSSTISQRSATIAAVCRTFSLNLVKLIIFIFSPDRKSVV